MKKSYTIVGFLIILLCVVNVNAQENKTEQELTPQEMKKEIKRLNNYISKIEKRLYKGYNLYRAINKEANAKMTLFKKEKDIKNMSKKEHAQWLAICMKEASSGEARDYINNILLEFFFE